MLRRFLAHRVIEWKGQIHAAVQTHSNLGDTLVSAAEAFLESSQMERSRHSYAEAFASYADACSLSTSEAGDDLPGLLQNWGLGLQSAGLGFKVPGRLINEFCMYSFGKSIPDFLTPD